ncbi:LysR family transcriptional regulator [Hymenobacter lutimineralis]|uniref:LysR family transcriptional regulator n=1 Tax=Hymenobacter lutimineralis TaxID=2606448 RepID=A0A5D6V9C8_9BACT|nr:LysR substrate-binding domain-containing protein [Hymenobacter lutimineralis]TYZ11950.1 LysR family transcriptional regulator [Hymenobacter lutimineralis]
MNIDTIALQCFIAVAETGSFTKAAERVGRTQSAISQQMSKLESLLGKLLLVRGKAFTLTPEGEIFLGYARRIFALHREALDRFKEPELEGEVRFGLPENFASVYLAEILADFSRIHPRILLNIECDLTLNLFDRFKKNEFDLVLVKMNRPEDLPNGLDVWSEPLKWVGDQSLIDPAKPVPLILAPQPCVYRASAVRSLEQASRSWRLVFSSPSYAGAVAAVRAGMGISVMPQTMIPDDLQAVDAAVLPKLADTHTSLIKHVANNAAVNTLEEFVLRRLKH